MGLVRLEAVIDLLFLRKKRKKAVVQEGEDPEIYEYRPLPQESGPDPFLRVDVDPLVFRKFPPRRNSPYVPSPFLLVLGIPFRSEKGMRAGQRVLQKILNEISNEDHEIHELQRFRGDVD